MDAIDPLNPKAGLERSTQLVSKALDMLDACGAPPHIAAHLELALAEMKTAIAEEAKRGS